MASRNPQRPNVLFILSDDQGPWAMGCAGNPELRTPALDRLAADGVRFTDFFCVSPVCSPARASLMTGEIPSRHGVHDWIRAGNMGAQRIDYLAGHGLLTDHVAAAGYRCGLVGKWHLGASDVPRDGFVRWFAHQSGMSPYYDAPMVDETTPCTVPGYLTERLTAEALAFLDNETGRDQPFFLCLNYTAPHYPWIDSHPREYTDLYADCAFTSCPQEAPHPWTAHGNPATDEGFRRPRESLIGYYASMTAMDAGIGEVRAAIEAAGLGASTLVIFMSDNGMNCGHHGIWGKGNGTRPQNMYDSSVKVPCVIAHPGRIGGGRVDDTLLSAYDFFPTMLDYLGLHVTPDPAKPGRTFAPLLRSETTAESGAESGARDGAKTGGTADATANEDRRVVVYDEYGPVRMVRTREWKYVHRHPDGPHELYDLRADPGERDNRYGSAGMESRTRALRAQLDTWFARYVDPSLDGTRKPVNGCGQLDRADIADPRLAFAEDPIKPL